MLLSKGRNEYSEFVKAAQVSGTRSFTKGLDSDGNITLTKTLITPIGSTDDLNGFSVKNANDVDFWDEVVTEEFLPGVFSNVASGGLEATPTCFLMPILSVIGKIKKAMTEMYHGLFNDVIYDGAGSGKYHSKKIELSITFVMEKNAGEVDIFKGVYLNLEKVRSIISRFTKSILADVVDGNPVYSTA